MGSHSIDIEERRGKNLGEVDVEQDRRMVSIPRLQQSELARNSKNKGKMLGGIGTPV